MGFHEVRFPANMGFGSTGGPQRRTEIVTLANGFEERNAPWSQSLHRYDAGMGLRSLDDVQALIAFFEARGGQLYGFRWKDWADFKSCAPSADPGPLDQRIGTGDGATRDFQLVKTYASGGALYQRVITKPVVGTVLVALADLPQREGLDYTVDAATGIVTLAEPLAAGVPVTAGFSFDVPVRFDTDRIEISVSNFQAGHVPHVPVVELRL
ncbi:MAG: DUF2460 domain-containing protein [Paracoccaceae bacterium]|nr:DUF2460 domain-containing protein [Paracoccaceae bacterium]MDE3121571.1 DUF2460 domain-containing protein [Paracoccaceae bacterium]